MPRTYVVMDSGAFSAWTSKNPINIKDYAKYCLENLEFLDYIVNLDVIPGEVGKKGMSATDPKIVDESASQGWQNYQYMLAQGVPQEKLIHVYHQEENIYWLERMIDSMEYIGFSPANDRSTNEKAAFLDKCFDLAAKNPHVKPHGFGVTSFKLMKRYPWYSVDSASWVFFSRFGIILVPQMTNGEFDFTKPPIKLFVSTKSPRKDSCDLHFDTATPLVQERVHRYLATLGHSLGESRIKNEIKGGPADAIFQLNYMQQWGPPDEEGPTGEIIISEGVCNNHRLRDLVNMEFYLRFVRALDHPTIFYLAGNFPQMLNPVEERRARDIVYESGYDYRRLVSYFYIKGCKTVLDMRKEEIENGTN